MYQMICPVSEGVPNMAGLDASDGQAQGPRSMKFAEVDGRTSAGALRQAEAAAVPGVSGRSFRRWGDRFAADGAKGLYDRLLGRIAALHPGAARTVSSDNTVRYRRRILPRPADRHRRHHVEAKVRA